MDPADSIGPAHHTGPDSPRGRSFGAAAAAYARHRPDYPDAAVDWALEQLAGQQAPRVLDLAAGTGKLTESLVHRRLDVVAVEPDESMRAELAARLPSVPALAGTAEAIPLPDGSVDAVLVGQAFHWFHPDRALAEAARVLRPGGLLGALWNTTDDRVDWVAGFVPLAHVPGRSEYEQLPLPQSHRLFTPFERTAFEHVHRRDAESLLATIATHSASLTMPAEQRELMHERVREYLALRPETAHGEFDLPLVTEVVRATVR